MKKLLLLAVLLPLVGASCTSQQQVYTNTNQNEVQGASQGRAVFSVTDAAASLQGVTAVNLTIDKVQVHSATQGWVTVSTNSRTFDLLTLKQTAKAELLADANLTADTYDQVRLHVSKVVVVRGSETTEAKLPSNDLKLVGQLVVKADTESSVLLDFKVDQSLHLTGQGTYIITPVVKLENRSSAQVQVGDDESVKVEGGDVDANVTLGTDENGEAKPDFMLGGTVKLDVTPSGVIHVMGSSQSETAAKVSAEQAVRVAKDQGGITVAVSVKLETKNGKAVWHVTGTSGLELKSVYVDANSGALVSIE